MAIPKILDLARRAINDEGGWLNDEVWLGPKRSSARGDYYDDAYLSPTALYLAPTSRVGVQKIVKLDNANGLVLMDYDYTNDTGFYSYQDILDSDGLRLYQTSDRYAYVTNTGSFGYNADTVYSGKLDFKGNNLEFNSQHLDGGYGLLDIDSGYLQLDQYSSGNSSRGYYTYLGNNQLFIRQYNSDGSMTNGTLEYDGVSGALDVQYYSNGKLNGSTIKLRGKDTDPYIKLTPYSNGVAKVNGGYLYLGGDQITSRYYEDSVSYWNFDISSYGIQFYQQYETGVYEEYYNQLYEDTLELSYYDGGSRAGGRIYGYRNSISPYINLYYYNNGTATYGYGQYKSNYLRMKKLYSTTDGSAHYGDLIIQNNSSSPYVQWKYYNTGSLNGYSFESYPIDSGTSTPYIYLDKYSSGSLVGRIEISHSINGSARGNACLQFTDYYGDCFYLDFHENSYEPESLVNKRYVDALVANIKTTEIYCGDDQSDVIDIYYSGSTKILVLEPGQYKLECWGAQGGGVQTNTGLDAAVGGKGGYSYGTIKLDELTTLYCEVGGMGHSSAYKALGGYNGGGMAWGSSTSEPGNGGGGATDIRVGQNSLYARVIVAGGGGGAGEDSGDVPGYGGGTTGSGSYYGQATTTSGGGTFGYGANTTYDGGGGGGGWYGGGTNGGTSSWITGNSSSDTSGGSGGSGYVYTSSTYGNYPSGCLLDSRYYLLNAATINGGTTITEPNGTSATGHSGDGHIRITKIKPTTYNFEYTGETQEIVLSAGTYTIECWGASGGNCLANTSWVGGKGGYVKGTLSLSSTTKAYINVGGEGESGNSTSAYKLIPGGWNGGGDCYTYQYGASGGGGTDVRIGSNSLHARAIVAGGGSGGSQGNGAGYAAGGLTGYCYSGQVTTANGYYAGAGSTTFGGYVAASYGTYNYYQPTSGDFGRGGMGVGYSAYGSGGGGGWYGGGGGYYTAGGGSSYIYSSSYYSYYPTGCLLNSNYYLTSTIIYDGKATITEPNGLSAVGHTGNGFVRITAISGTVTSDHKLYVVGVDDNTTNAYHTPKINSNIYMSNDVLFGAAWNDYAEFRKTEKAIGGSVVIESPDGQMKLSHERLLPGAEIVSDTYGFAIGKTATYSTPIAVSGRVLAYPNEDRYSYPLGAAVCSGPNGTVSLMTREEIREYPERIIGTVSEIPEYEVWGERQVKVNGRIWIRVR